MLERELTKCDPEKEVSNHPGVQVYMMTSIHQLNYMALNFYL